jgi:hypothetical protein
MDYLKTNRKLRCDMERCKEFAHYYIGVEGSSMGNKITLCDKCIEGIMEVGFEVLDRKVLGKLFKRWQKELDRPEEYFQARDIVMAVLGKDKKAYVDDIKSELEKEGLWAYYKDVCQTMNLVSVQEGNKWLRYCA